jgi:hypothetical protein
LRTSAIAPNYGSEPSVRLFHRLAVMHLHGGDPDIMGSLFAEAAVGHLNHRLAFRGLSERADSGEAARL